QSSSPRGFRVCMLPSLLAGIVLFVLAPDPSAHAQIISGDLVVRVVDNSDLIVPGAAMVLTDVDTGVTYDAVSDGQGMDVFVELPLNGRNFIQPAQLSAGAVPLGIGVSPASTWTGRGDTTLSIAGGRESNNSFLVNGIETRNARFGNAGIRPSVDAIQEFKIQRSTFGAEFGRSAAIINTTLKSGTNQWHGSTFEFNRDARFDANDFF